MDKHVIGARLDHCLNFRDVLLRIWSTDNRLRNRVFGRAFCGFFEVFWQRKLGE